MVGLLQVYGQNAADEISTMCNTRIFFRSPSNEAAVWTSKELGQHEIEEMREGISYGESAMRSGISINKQIVHKDLVSPAEIMRLHALEAYVRLPGELPIAKIKLKYKTRSTDVTPFLARNIIKQDFDASENSTEPKVKTKVKDSEQPKEEKQKVEANDVKNDEENEAIKLSCLQQHSVKAGNTDIELNIE